MAFKPQPTTYNCPKCGWSKTVSPKSDALMPGDIIQECPKCGNDQLEAKRAGLVDQLLAAIKNTTQR
jgi:peptide subunit release factor 1 (eRF1)